MSPPAISLSTSTSRSESSPPGPAGRPRRGYLASKQSRTEGGVDVLFARCHLANGLHQLYIGGFLDEVADGSGVEGSPQIGDVVVHGEHEHPGRRAGLADVRRRRDPAAVGQPDVHNEHVGLRLAGELDGLRGGAGFPHDLKVGLRLEDGTQTAANHGVVIAQRDPDPVSHGRPPASRRSPRRASN